MKVSSFEMIANKMNEELTTMNEMVNLMADRHSIRVFDETKTIPEETLKAILETMRLAPASYGLFNVRTLVLPRSKFRNQLNDLFYQQKNFITASHYVIFLVDSGEQIKHHTIFETANAMFGASDSPNKNRYVENFQELYDSKFWNQPEAATGWSTRQAYIAGGVATVTAAGCGVGTCMMEGFDLNKLRALLREKNLITKHQYPVLGLAMGYPDPNVPLKNKVRLPFSEYVTVVTK